MSAAGPDPTSGVELQTSPGARPSSASVNGVKLEDHTAQAATGHERKSSDHDQEQNRHNHAITASLEHGLEADDNDPVVAAEQNFLPPGPRLYLVVACLMLAVFCIALDNTVGVPIPVAVFCCNQLIAGLSRPGSRCCDPSDYKRVQASKSCWVVRCELPSHLLR
jgi:hypothetical protein